MGLLLGQVSKRGKGGFERHTLLYRKKVAYATGATIGSLCSPLLRVPRTGSVSTGEAKIPGTTLKSLPRRNGGGGPRKRWKGRFA